MITRRGTTLICLATEDGVFLAADDLMYVEREGQAVPHQRDFRKVGATDNVLIGTAGLMVMVHPAFKYLVTDWTTDLLNKLEDIHNELPSSVAERIYQKLRETFKPAEPLVTQGVWKGYLPGDRLVNFVIAGYTKNFKRPYIFEVGVEINRNNDGLTYISPIPHQKPVPHHVRFGEDYYIERVDAGIEPEHSVWAGLVDCIFPDVVRAFPSIPPAFQESVACTVGCIKVEAHFNPQKVGSKANVVLIDRNNRAVLSAAF
jgi:hypothetical protein